MNDLTFHDLLAMKLEQQSRKLDILRSLSKEDIIRLNNEGVGPLSRALGGRRFLQSRLLLFHDPMHPNA